MRILCVDVGTGTQDILLFDSELELENCIKLVMPSPTMVVAERVRAATKTRTPLLLTGVTMGGGPCHWAVMDHVRAGAGVYALPDAARTFDDDLETVRQMGIQVISEDEAAALDGVERLELKDFWMRSVLDSLDAFGAPTRIEAVAVAVFDHGAAPPGYSDRVFRFDYLSERLKAGGHLPAFAFAREQVPTRLTRLMSVASSVPEEYLLLVMDTAPAAVLGALEDDRLAQESELVVANIGNFHCLAFQFRQGAIQGLFEHHTGEVTPQKLETYLRQLMAGSISNQEVLADMGHGALVLDAQPPSDEAESAFVAVTGPRRQMMRQTSLPHYMAVPHGDMMLAGCYGLLRAWAERDHSVREQVERRLGPARLAYAQSS